MQTEHLIGVTGAVFFAVCGVLLFDSVRRGRELCRLFAERLPNLYEAAGSPRPGYFNSPRRHAYFRFLMQRKYEAIEDPFLLEEFSRRRRVEMFELWLLLAGFAAAGVAFLWLRFLS